MQDVQASVCDHFRANAFLQWYKGTVYAAKRKMSTVFFHP